LRRLSDNSLRAPVRPEVSKGERELDLSCRTGSERNFLFAREEKMASNNKYVFPFEEGDGKNKKLLGGKGANLCEMTQIGLPVPPGFVISTEACLAYLAQGKRDLQP
jgi:hypothetical protein